MIVVVTGRQGGKTTAMIQWFLNGRPIDTYPYWSRVILCPTHEQVVYVTNKVREATASFDENNQSTWDIRKAIWSLEDLNSVKKHHGTRDIEIGVDNMELIIEDILNGPISFATMTGKLQS